jgi:hypothetical protein
LHPTPIVSPHPQNTRKHIGGSRSTKTQPKKTWSHPKPGGEKEEKRNPTEEKEEKNTKEEEAKQETKEEGKKTHKQKHKGKKKKRRKHKTKEVVEEEKNPMPVMSE